MRFSKRRLSSFFAAGLFLITGIVLQTAFPEQTGGKE